MPIHFRCPHCNQLMGIARRKSGAIINCPTCDRQLIVPRPGAKKGVDWEKVVEPSPLLEKMDIDALLGPPQAGRAEGSAADPPSAPAGGSSRSRMTHRKEPAPKNGPSEVEALGAGIFLTPGRATVLSVLAVFLLAIALVIGLLLGRYVWPAAEVKSAWNHATAAWQGIACVRGAAPESVHPEASLE